VLSAEHAARMFVFSQYGSRSSSRWFALKAANPAIEPQYSGLLSALLPGWLASLCWISQACDEACGYFAALSPVIWVESLVSYVRAHRGQRGWSGHHCLPVRSPDD
ncbi:hypothetical protein ACWDA8_45410, partial [Streptomyces sp. NPDC001130]